VSGGGREGIKLRWRAGRQLCYRRGGLIPYFIGSIPLREAKEKEREREREREREIN
jgi:hypothetical protein